MRNTDSLYLKYRPKTLDEVIGNRIMIDALSTVVKDKKSIPHAILLTGNSGCGKTTIARIIKDILGCADMDYKEVDSADFRGIETVRDIRRQMMLKPLSGSCRVWLLDEAHQLTAKDAQPALLKALEDTPRHVYFILATTDPHKLIPTVRNRCMTFEVQPLSERLLDKLIKDVVGKEKKSISEQALELIIRQSLGSPRSALMLLQKVIDLDSTQQTRAVEQAVSEESQVIDLCRALMNKNISWKKVRAILKGLQEQDAEGVRRAVLGYCSSVLVNDDNPLAYVVMDCFKYNFYDTGFAGLVLACYEVLGKSEK